MVILQCMSVQFIYIDQRCAAIDSNPYFDDSGNVDTKSAVRALAALAQDSRLDVFRLLVQAGPEGMPAGEIAERLGIPSSTLSFHVKALAHAGLVESRQQGRFIYYSARQIAGHIYEIYGVYPAAADSMMLETPEVTNLEDATATANVKIFQRAATRFNGATFLIGPTDGNLVPERLPKGLTEEHARALIESPGSVSSYTGGSEELRRAPRALARRLGARWWGIAAFGPDTDPISSAKSSQQSQSLVFVGVYRKNPDVALMWEQLGATPLLRAQVWVATNVLVLLGLLGALFLAALAASPWALARERRLTEEAELERQRELVRREARERVIGRLTALSRQIEDAARRSDVESREVASVARDIDETVRELKTILGDLTTRDGE